MTTEELENLLMPQLEKMAVDLRQEFTHVRANAYSCEIGSRTNYHGHDYGVDCVISDAKPEDPDNVALIIETSYLTTTPRINANVWCGLPSGLINLRVFEESQPLTPEAVERVIEDLPRLHRALQEAIAGLEALRERP